MLPTNCPTCGQKMTVGFVLAGEDGDESFYWTDADPREEIVRPTPIQLAERPRSFRNFTPEPNAVEARRCDKCRLFVFHVAEKAD